MRASLRTGTVVLLGFSVRNFAPETAPPNPWAGRQPGL
jgi:hypothetical protein